MVMGRNVPESPGYGLVRGHRAIPPRFLDNRLGREADCDRLGFSLMVVGMALWAGPLFFVGIPIFLVGLVLTLRCLD